MRAIDQHAASISEIRATALSQRSMGPSADGFGKPESSGTERAVAFGVFVFSLLYLFIFRRHTSIDADEGIILQGAQRILDGQVLYRDFFSFFTPGSYYLTALILHCFGDTFLVARTTVAFIGAAFAPITYVLARRVCSRQISLLVTVLMTATAVPVRFLVLHNWDSTLWAALALYCAVRLLESRASGWAFATGSFASLTVLFEQSKGAGLWVGLGSAFLLIAVSHRYPNLFTRKRVALLAVGLAWPFLITIFYFASQHALGVMLTDWFWPIHHYSAANRVPYGYPDLSEDTLDSVFHTGSFALRAVEVLAFLPALWLPVLPLFAVALLPRLIAGVWRKQSFDADWGYYMLVSTSVTGLLFCGVVAVRADRVHFFYLQPIFLLVLAWLLDGKDIRGPVFRRLGKFLTVCVTLSLVPSAMALLFSVTAPHVTQVTRRGIVVSSSRDTVLDYVQAHVAPGEKILVYPYSSLYYFLTATRSSTAFEYFQPGMNTDEQAREMLNELSAHPVRVVIFEPTFLDHIGSWPNTPLSALATDRVGDYILREYHSCKMLSSADNWHFQFMVRRDATCP